MRYSPCFVVPLMLIASALAAEPPSPRFTRKPVATRTGQGARIEFAVNRFTDVTVYVENQAGVVVRHLVCGVLGKNPPKPLKANALSQSIEWDGKDDDGKVATGAFKVRVAIGLGLSWAGTPFSPKPGPAQIGGGGVAGMATGPDGRLYVLGRRGGKTHWMGMRVMHVFRRDGSYEKTIMPPPSALPESRLKGIGAFRNARGALTPLLHHPHFMTFYPHVPVHQQMAVTAGGQVLMAVRPIGKAKKYEPGPGVHLATIDSDGGTPHAAFAGEVLHTKLTRATYSYLAAGSDGASVFMTGLGTMNPQKGKRHQTRNSHAVFRLPLKARAPAQVLFGDPMTPGKGDTGLNNPRGLAVDGKGHLLVADKGNNRVVVLDEKTGRLSGSFDVPAPLWLGVDAQTGSLYVQSGKDLVKFSGWKKPRELARLKDLPRLFALRHIGPGYRKYLRVSLALDTSARPPVLWIGRSSGPRSLLRCEDRGTEFTKPVPARYYDSPEFWNLSAEPSKRKLVSCRVEPARLGGNWTKTLHVLDEETGKVRPVYPRPSFTHQGPIFRLAPGGRLFGMQVLRSISRHDANGKFLSFGTPPSAKGAKDAGLLGNKPTGNSGWTRDFCVDRRGDLYVTQRLAGNLIKIVVYDGATGKLKRTAISLASRHALGPRVDAAGNIYMAEALKAPGRPYPEEFTKHLEGRANAHWYRRMYGSLLKFSPEGGAIWWPVKEAAAAIKPKLPATQKAAGCYNGRMLPENPVLYGAAWFRPDFAHIGMRPMCHCLATDFDVDDFGRSFYPDLLRFRVGVLDTNGNEITHIGSYGNQDSCGPDSYVLDAKGKFLRPRSKTDPENADSPSSKPDIGFAWISGIAVTDRFVYVSDEVNRRVVRCKMQYSADETCSVK